MSLIVNVVVYDDHSEAASALQPQEIVRLRGVSVTSLYSGYCELCIHKGHCCGIQRLPVDAPEVLQLKSLLDKQQPDGLSNIISVTSHPDVPYASVSEIINSSKVPWKYHVKAQILQVVQPPTVELMVKLYCSQCGTRYQMAGSGVCDVNRELHNAGEKCLVCINKSPNLEEKPSTLKYAYMIEVKLEDYTGVLNAYIVEQDAATMFQELPATNLYTDHGCRDALLSKLSYLCGGESPFNIPKATLNALDRPWLDCCIKSYYIGGKPKDGNPGDESNHKTDQHKVAYRIFDTVLNLPKSAN